MKSSVDRVVAARLLVRVEGGAFSSRLLAGRSARGVRVRVLGVLRWLSALDAVLAPLCRRGFSKLDPEVRSVLRIGLFEAMYLDTPPALATDGGVRSVRRLGCSSASGMVNAVLRRATSRWQDVLADAAINIRFAHPEWISQRWSKNFGAEKTGNAMAAAQQPAATWVWFLNDATKDELLAQDFVLEEHPWCSGAWSCPNNVRRLIQEVEAGTAYAQDPSSQLIAHIANEVANNSCRFLDLCAAPGGKSALMLHRGKMRTAVSGDITLSRTRLMHPLLKRMGASAVVVADVLNSPYSEGIWDLVLLDAPCSGTGTFRRHPELKWRLRPEAISDRAANQRRMLLAGLPMLAEGGVLIYSTCSVEPEENEGVVSELPRGFEICAIEGIVTEKVPWYPTSAGGVRILPCTDGDGFTVHFVRRKKRR